MIATDSVCQLVNELKVYGYDLYLDGENLRYKFHSLIEPPKERVAVLLDSLRRNKPEVISYLRANERPNKPLSFHEAGLDIQKMPLSDVTLYCSWIKKDVPRGECLKPLSCFHRDKDDRPVECIYLKAFIRQRNRELGLDEAFEERAAILEYDAVFSRQEAEEKATKMMEGRQWLR